MKQMDCVNVAIDQIANAAGVKRTDPDFQQLVELCSAQYAELGEWEFKIFINHQLVTKNAEIAFRDVYQFQPSKAELHAIAEQVTRYRQNSASLMCEYTFVFTSILVDIASMLEQPDRSAFINLDKIMIRQGHQSLLLNVTPQTGAVFLA